MNLNDSLGGAFHHQRHAPTGPGDHHHLALMPLANATRLQVRSDHAVYRSATDDEILASARQILASRLSPKQAFNKPDDAKMFLQLEIGTLEHEVFVVIFLDSQHRLIAMKQLFRGTVHQTSVYPREVVKEALALNACALLCAHNHPSGDSTPSQADQRLTQTLKTACSLVDIRVLDHVIVSGSDSCSMAERGLM